jgi:hypothetical protein
MTSLLLLFLFLSSGQVFAAQHTLNCSFHGLKKNEKPVDLGSTKKSIDPKYDFSITVPKTDDSEWSTVVESLSILGSVDTPKKGWIGLAFSSNQKPNDGWACIKLSSGQHLILTKTSGDLTINADCNVR